MAYQLRAALEGGEEAMKKRIEARNQEVTKLAYRKPKRLRDLEKPAPVKRFVRPTK